MRRRISASMWLAAALSACVPGAPPVVGAEDAAPKDRGTASDASDPADSGVVELEDSGAEDTGEHPDAFLPDAAPISDGDGDGIPDGEDPNPGYLNPLLFEDTFESTSSGWIFSSVSMEISPGASLLRVFQLEPFEREGWIGPRPNWADYLVRTLLRVNGVGSGNDVDSGFVAVMARVSQVTPSRYVACGLNLKTGKVQVIEYEGTSRSVLGEADTSAAEGTWVLIDFSADATGYRCKVGPTEVTGSSGTFFAGAIGFRSFDATFDADWIEVYELEL
jgi:hypothetical protein